MKTRMRRHARHALVLGLRDITSIWRRLDKFYPSIIFTARCIDGSIFETAELTDIIDFDNPNVRRIESMDISARKQYDERLTLEFRDAASTARLSIESEEYEHAVHTTSDVMNLVLEARPSYSFVTRYKATAIVMCVWVIWAMWSSVRRFVGAHPPQPPASTLAFFDSFILSVLVVVVVFALVWPIDKLQRWLFPRLFFKVGCQQDEWDQREKWRSIVFVGFALSLLTSLAAAFIFKHLG
jgi:hypothetical protein